MVAVTLLLWLSHTVSGLRISVKTIDENQATHDYSKRALHNDFLKMFNEKDKQLISG